MDNQHRKINTYRDFDEDTVNRINKIKALEEQITEEVYNIINHINSEEMVNAVAENDAYLAKDNLKTGFMFLVRAIAQPNASW